MKKIVVSVAIVAAVFAASAEDLYFCPNADGAGLANWASSGDSGWLTDKVNWTNALGEAKSPTSSDMIWFYQTPTNTQNGSGGTKNAGRATGSGTVYGVVYTNGMNTVVSQGQMTLVAGGPGVKLNPGK